KVSASLKPRSMAASRRVNTSPVRFKHCAAIALRSFPPRQGRGYSEPLMTSARFSATFDDIWIVEGARTPFVDYCGAFGDLTPTDMGIKAARGALERAGIAATEVGSVITASMAPGDFYAYMLPRHIGLYSGVPIEVPAANVQRICGSGFEIIRQAGDDIARGYANV